MQSLIFYNYNKLVCKCWVTDTNEFQKILTYKKTAPLFIEGWERNRSRCFFYLYTLRPFFAFTPRYASRSFCLSSFLACLFRRKSRAIVIARSLSQCKNFNIAHYLKSIEVIDTKLGVLAHHDKMQLQDKGHNWKL